MSKKGSAASMMRLVLLLILGLFDAQLKQASCQESGPLQLHLVVADAYIGGISSTLRQIPDQSADAVPVDRITSRKTVFIGGVGPRYHTLADAAANRQMLAAGNIGLYQHANGNALLTPAQRSALWATWKVVEFDHATTVAEIGSASVDDPGYLSYFGGQYPSEVNLNVPFRDKTSDNTYVATLDEYLPGTAYPLSTSVADLTHMKLAIDQTLMHGAGNVAVFMTPNGGFEDLNDPFATGGYWANVRAAALYGRAIGIDTPPSYWLARGPAYQAFIVQMVEWANANNIRSSLAVSPYALVPDDSGNSGGCGFDASFYRNTKALVTSLLDARTVPSEWVVESYGLAGPHCGTENDVRTDLAPDSLNAVALYLACVMRPLTLGTSVSSPGNKPAYQLDESAIVQARLCR